MALHPNDEIHSRKKKKKKKIKKKKKKKIIIFVMKKKKKKAHDKADNRPIDWDWEDGERNQRCKQLLQRMRHFDKYDEDDS